MRGHPGRPPRPRISHSRPPPPTSTVITRQAASEPNLNANGPGGRMEDGSGSQAPNREPTAGPVAPHRMPRKRPGARCCSGGGGRAGGDAASKSASQGLLSTRSTHGDIAERGSVGDAGVPVGAAAQVKLRGGRAGPRQSWKQETRELLSLPCVLGWSCSRCPPAASSSWYIVIINLTSAFVEAGLKASTHQP